MTNSLSDGDLADCRPVHRFSSAADVADVERMGVRDFLLASSPYLILRDSSERHPDRVAIQYVENPAVPENIRRVTYGELFRQATRIANMLYELGLRPDRVAAYLMPNVPETHALVWGGSAAGIIAPINHYLEPAHIARMLRELGAEILVTHGPLPGFDITGQLPAILGGAPNVRHVICFGDLPRDVGQILSAERLMTEQPADGLSSGRSINDDDMAAYFHTGGTTGAPKFAGHTHLNQALAAHVTAFGMGVEASDIVFSAMPLFHTGGLMGCGLVTFSQGGTVFQVAPAGFRDPAVIPAIWSLLQTFGVSILVGPPTIYASLVRIPVNVDLAQVKHATSSAAGLPLEVLKRFEAHSGIKIREAYGMTEASLLLSANPPYGESKPGSVGLRLPFVEIDIVRRDPTDGRVERCRVGESGSVATRGPMVFPGYLGRGLPAEMDLGEAWVDTGDLGRLDQDGYLFLTGRSKDVIIRGGHNIDPLVIEAVIEGHPDVMMCAAVGRPDRHAGEVPVAYITRRDGCLTDAETFLSFAAATIGERAALPKAVYIVESLPMTAVGKIAKNELRLLAAQDAVEAALHDLLEAGRVRSVKAVQAKDGVQVLLEGAEGNEPDIADRLHGFGITWKLDAARR